MDLQLAGKSALVTGASAGIGEAIARSLAAEGVSVVVHGRNRFRVDAVVEAITVSGGKAMSVTGDLQTPQDVEALADTVLGLGHVDILVNNAGGRTTEGAIDWSDIDVDQWAKTYQLNVVAPARLISRVLAGMKARGWGRIIQISSVGGVLTRSDSTEYGASKAAANSMVVGLSKALAGTGITANAVSPGSIMTPAFQGILEHQATANGWTGSPAEIERQAVMARWPNDCQRLGTPEEIASAVTWLASPLNGFVTGANIRVDGGRTGVTT